jgi:hypothetical protein
MLYRGTLTLRPVAPTDLPTEQWHKVGGWPTVAAVFADCRPPLAALSG